MDNRPLSIDIVRFSPFPSTLHTYSGYFEPYSLSNTAPNCSITVNTNADSVFGTDQQCIDRFGDVIQQESEKLGLICDTFSQIEDALTTLYSQG